MMKIRVVTIGRILSTMMMMSIRSVKSIKMTRHQGKKMLLVNMTMRPTMMTMTMTMTMIRMTMTVRMKISSKKK